MRSNVVGLVARLGDRRRGDDRAVVREQHAARVADLASRATSRRSRRSTPPYSSTNASSPSKMHEFWCTSRGSSPHRREQRGVVRVVVHDRPPRRARARCSSVCRKTAGVTSQRPSTISPSASSRRTSDACTSSHHMPHGLHHIPPSSVATVMWPDRFSRQPSRARMRSAHASCCRTVSSRPMPGPGRGNRAT